jgi:hypothetical protein
VACAAVVLGVVSGAVVATAQSKAPVEPHVKAAFLYNFVKFIEWPDDRVTGGPVTVCISGSPAVAESLRAAAHQRRPDQPELTVVEVAMDAPPRTCHLVYVADTDQQAARRWIAALTGSRTFTVSDSEHFAKLGGVANFFVQDGRLRFAINVDAARRASLRISSRMLALAQIVTDERQGSDVRISR